jgi:uncharacterized protein
VLSVSWGGLVGLGGAEFRLPILLTVFGYKTIQAVVLNLLVSLVTVTFSFIFRSGVVGLAPVTAHMSIIVNILSGSVIGSYLGAHFASNVRDKSLNFVIVVLLIALSLVLMGHDFIHEFFGLQISSFWRIFLGFFSGIFIGAVSTLLGVAGGELIIPTIILIFGTDIKLAGSLSLAISIPTIVIGLFKYHRQRRLTEAASDRAVLIYMALGSILGSFIGSYLLSYVATLYLHFLLGFILLISAVKLALHHR